MSIGRRKVSLHEESSWVFNRMVEAYAHRPDYPDELLDHLCALVSSPRAKIVDVGAGLGHLALPLAARGHHVTAIEPAVAMLTELRRLAASRRLPLEALHGAAESIPVADATFDLVVIADAVHFMDSERAAYEVARVIAPRGALALVTVELTPTPFMSELIRIMEDSAPRRPRDVSSSLRQLLAVAGIQRWEERVIHDRVAVDQTRLEGILRSISFIGPAMNARRFAAFRQRVASIPHPPHWARTLTVHSGSRS